MLVLEILEPFLLEILPCFPQSLASCNCLSLGKESTRVVTECNATVLKHTGLVTAKEEIIPMPTVNKINTS